MSDPETVAEAQADADRARARLMATLATLKNRLSPKSLVRGAGEKLKDTGAGVARSGVDVVKHHPLPTIGVVAAITAFFTRRSLARLIGRRKKS